jgi:hypothetical protein
MPDPYDHSRRLAASAVAYLHACGCGLRRDHAGERRVLEAFIHASGAVIRQPSDTGEDTR